MNKHAINAWEFMFEVIYLHELTWTSDPEFSRLFINMVVHHKREFEYAYKKLRGNK